MFLFTVLAGVGRIGAVGLHSTCVFAKTWKHPCGLVCLAQYCFCLSEVTPEDQQLQLLKPSYGGTFYIMVKG